MARPRKEIDQKQFEKLCGLRKAGTTSFGAFCAGTDRSLCVYRYIDMADNEIKYVGIVRKAKLKDRIMAHEDDRWCKGKMWRVEYFGCDTQAEVEAFEAHLIAIYGTGKYYNTQKVGWGINKYLPDVENWWKPATRQLCADYETLDAVKMFRRMLRERKMEAARFLFDLLEVAVDEAG